MADDDFDKEMADVEWAEVYERQVARGALVDEVAELLGLDGGAVVEVGSGPGYTAIRLAEAAGTVYAVDRHPDALRYCRRKLAEEGVGNVRLVATDAEAFALRFAEPTAVLVAFVLHHADAPEAVLAEVGAAVPADSRLLVVEYRPDADGEFGPPLDRRIAPETVEKWLDDAGFVVEAERDLPEEKYGVLARRRRTPSRDAPPSSTSS